MPEQPTPPPEPRGSPQHEDWLDEFYLRTFLSLVSADHAIERREVVWIKRFFERNNRPRMLDRLDQVLASGDVPDPQQLTALVEEAAGRMSSADKRSLVYNMAQLCKAKGSISSAEYENVLDLAGRLGISETDADSIVNSVFKINETFAAIVGLLALGVILYFTRTVIVPLVIAIFITMIIGKVESMVSGALRLRRMRWLNKIFAMLLILSVLFGLVMAAVISGRDIALRFQFYKAKLVTLLAQVEVVSRGYGLEALTQTGLRQQLADLPVGDTLGALFSSTVTWIGDFFLIVIFVGFLTFSGLSNRGLLQEMNDKTSAYISIKSMMGLVTGIAVVLVCWAFGVDFALFWATLAFLLNFIPSVGSIIASIPPVLVALVQLDSVARALLFGLLLGAVHVTLGNVLEPKLMGGKLAIKPVALLLGLIFWGFLWGLPGMFMAAPLMALLRILASYFNFSRGFERLLAAD